MNDYGSENGKMETGMRRKSETLTFMYRTAIFSLNC